MYDLVIHHGTVVTSTGIFQGDIGITGGKIVELAPNLTGRELISALGMLVLPGGVDPHVHIEMPAASTVTSDTWETGTRAAAFGGTTTVVDFVEPFHPRQPLVEAFQERLRQAQGRSNIDYSFHMTLCTGDGETLSQVPDVVKAGMTSFKLYTTYPGFHLSDEDLLAALEAVEKAGGLAIVHAESDAIIQNATRRLREAGRLAVKDFPESRPGIAEVEAIDRVLSLAAYARAPVYIVHVSTGGGAAAISRALQRGQTVWGETCPQYLVLNEGYIKSSDFSGAKFVCCPPLRGREDNQALWNALQDGSLHAVGTDHCAFNYRGQKDLGKDSFLEIPPGLPGIELRLALLYTYGVKTGKITLPRLVDLCSTAPARLFGLHPRKGDLLPGADADIILFDPNRKAFVSQPMLHEDVDYTPYEGMELAGMVRSTILRGQVLVRDGEWVSENHPGNFVIC